MFLCQKLLTLAQGYKRIPSSYKVAPKGNDGGWEKRQRQRIIFSEVYIP